MRRVGPEAEGMSECATAPWRVRSGVKVCAWRGKRETLDSDWKPRW